MSSKKNIILFTTTWMSQEVSKFLGTMGYNPNTPHFWEVMILIHILTIDPITSVPGHPTQGFDHLVPPDASKWRQSMHRGGNGRTLPDPQRRYTTVTWWRKSWSSKEKYEGRLIRVYTYVVYEGIMKDICIYVSMYIKHVHVNIYIYFKICQIHYVKTK